MGDVFTVHYEGGSYLLNDPGDEHVAAKVRIGEPYERKLLQDVRNLGLSGTVFDVGAHVGNHAVWFGVVCGLKVCAWEPDAGRRRALRANLKLNSVRARVFAWAAGAETGRGRMNDAMEIKLNRGNLPVCAIDDKIVVDDLAVVKVDVEGMEHLVLAGMVDHLDRCSPVVYTECHSDEAHVKVAKILEPLGYTMDKRIVMGSTMERWRRV